MFLQSYLLSVCLLLAAICSAQSRLGYTEEAIIKKEFPDKNFTSGYFDNHVRYISWEDQDIKAIYCFNDQKLSDFCAISPKKDQILNLLVEKYNREYVVISHVEWKQYSDKSIMRIKLIYTDNTRPFFSFTEYTQK